MREFAANANIDSAIKAKVKILSIKLRENANWIVVKRKGIDFSPKDFEKVCTFLAADRLRQTSPLAKFVKSEQFEKITSTQIAVGGGEEKKERGAEGGKNDKKKKKKKKAKMEKKRRSKMEKERMQKNKKIDAELKKKYDERSGGKNVELTGIGDVVQDFELSD